VPTSTPAAERSRFIEHGGIRVILLDFHGITDPAEGLAAVAAATKFIAALTPDGSHYTLTDVRQTRYDKQIVDAFKGFTQHNRPYIRAAAIVSDSALHRAAISMIAIVSRRKLAVFDSREAALAYLASEDAAAKSARR
jgi:hypothetical protein